MQGALFGSECRNSDFRRGTSRFFCIGLHVAPPDGLLLCFGRGYPSGSRDLISPTSCLFGPAESTSRAHSATVLRQRHGADRAPARAARNGCAASKTRLTTCEAQTAMASSHRAASWIEGQRSPTDVTWALFQHGRGLLSRPGTAWHRCLRGIVQASLSVLVLQERHPCTFLHALCHYSCVAYPGDCCALWQAWRVLPLAGLVVCPSRP